MRTVLITGGAGLLGSTLIRLAPEGVRLCCTQRRTPAVGCPAHTVELSDAAAVRALLDRIRPDLVIHTAYSADAGERDILAATESVVEGSLEVGAELVYLSTDALLDGRSAPYAEEAEPDPVHEYGRWKAHAERLVRQRAPGAAVIRTSLIVSLKPLDPRCAWVRAGLQGEAAVSLFTDELRCPIAADDLAGQIWELCTLAPDLRRGVWHLAGPEAISRYALGVLLAARWGLPADRLRPAGSDESPAPRPRDLRLLTGRADRELSRRARPISAVVMQTSPGEPGEARLE